MLALSWKIFVTVSRLGAIWLDVTRKGKSRNPADQWKHRNKDTVPKNMLQFGWPNVCSVCMSQIQNKFSNFMNNSTESNWSGHCNTQLKIDTQDRNPPPRGTWITPQWLLLYTQPVSSTLRDNLIVRVGYHVNCNLEYLCPRWKVRQRSTASCQNFLPDTWIVEKVCLLHCHAGKQKSVFSKCLSPSSCVLLTFWLA